MGPTRRQCISTTSNEGLSYSAKVLALVKLFVFAMQGSGYQHRETKNAFGQSYPAVIIAGIVFTSKLTFSLQCTYLMSIYYRVYEIESHTAIFGTKMTTKKNSQTYLFHHSSSGYHCPCLEPKI